MLILALTSGVMAQGLRVYAQNTIQIGTIAIAEVAQPALAVVWSFLLLGEVVNARQVTGIAIVMAGVGWPSSSSISAMVARVEATAAGTGGRGAGPRRVGVNRNSVRSGRLPYPRGSRSGRAR